MRRLLATALLTAGIALGAVAPAQAGRSLSWDRAHARAERAAKQMARQDKRITEWEVGRGFRFTSRKFVFAWWAQLADGRICTAQLVTRYNSSKTYRLIAYFRNEECS
jgi:hypothetical protein